MRLDTKLPCHPGGWVLMLAHPEYQVRFAGVNDGSGSQAGGICERLNVIRGAPERNVVRERDTILMDHGVESWPFVIRV
jgi:hypothetical protein